MGQIKAINPYHMYYWNKQCPKNLIFQSLELP